MHNFSSSADTIRSFADAVSAPVEIVCLMMYQITGQFKQIEQLPADGGGDMTALTLTPGEWEEQKEPLDFPSSAGLEHRQIRRCRTEAHPKYIFGSLCIPDRKQLLHPPLKFVFYVNARFLIFVDDTGAAGQTISRLLHRYDDREMSPEFFLSAFLQEFLNEDIELLEKYESHLFLMEERALRGNIKNLLTNILKSRRELTRLRNYYEQMKDLARDLSGNSKDYFDSEKLQVLNSLSDRADQLQGIAQQAIDYCQTLRDFEQAQSDHKQNKTIQFLTIMTSIFFPLTVITGWYGMNFSYMPEINTRYGYFIVIAVSAAVIAFELIILRLRKMI